MTHNKSYRRWYCCLTNIVTEGGGMTRGSIREYTEVVRGRYLKSKRKEKGRALDEFVQVTGYHRKTAIRLLNRNNSQKQRKRRGRRRCYGNEVVDALRQVWEASDRLCSKRLKPFLGEMVRGNAAAWRTIAQRRPGSPAMPDEPSYHRPGTAAMEAFGRTKPIEYYQAWEPIEELHTD